MKANFLQSGAIIILFALVSAKSLFAQCPNDNQFWFDGQQPPCNIFSSVLIGGGTYATFDVVTGNIYTFSTCNSSFNTQLTAYDLGGNFLFYNDDNGSECASDRASFEWSATLSGKIRVLVDSFSCTTFSATSALLQYRQKLTITSSNASMCSGETRTLAANTPGGSFSGTGVSGTVFTAPATNGTYTVTYTFGNCSANQFIQVNQNPSVTITSLDGLTFCSGDSARLIANATAGSGFINSYQWKRNGVNVGANSGNLSTFQDGSYTVEVTNSNGCKTVSSPIVLTELQSPTVSFSGFSPAYCLRDPLVYLTGSPSGGTFNGPGIVATSFNPLLAGVGTHAVTYSYTAPNGCTRFETQNVMVNDQPLVFFNVNPSTFCTDDAAITLSATPAGGVFSGPVTSGNIFDPSTAGAGIHRLYYTSTTPLGCVSVDSVDVTVRQSPTASFSGLNSDYCITEPGSILTGIPPGGVFSGTGVGGNTFVPFLAGMGSHSVTYLYTAPNGCTASQTQASIVTDVPVLVFNINPNKFCIDGAPVALSATPAGGTFNGTGVTGGFFDPQLAGIGGPYTITYTFTDTIGCRNTASANQGVTVHDLPVVSISGLAPEYCLNAIPALMSGTPPGGTFAGNGISGNTFDPGTAGVGPQQVSYAYTDNNGCSNSQSATTFIQPLPVVSLSGLNPVYCEDDAVALMTGTPPGGFYAGPGLIANSFNPALAGPGGPYDIVYSYTDANNCSSSDTLQVSVNAIPAVSITGLNAVYCVYLEDIPLTLTPAGGQLSGNGVSGNAFNPSSAGIGNHFLIYVYSDGAGCANSTTASVEVAACVGVNSLEENDLIVFPNPASGKVTIKIRGNNLSEDALSVYDVTGKKLMQMQASETLIIDFSRLPKGIYNLRLKTESGVIVRKVVLE